MLSPNILIAKSSYNFTNNYASMQHKGKNESNYCTINPANIFSLK